MTPYRATFERHRLLLLAPITICALLALWTVAGTPHSYRSTASLWIDTGPTAATSVTDLGVATRTPAEQEQLIVQELMATRDFRLGIAHASPLAAHLAKTPVSGWSPPALLSRVRGAKPVDVRILDALGPKRVVTTVAGPQLLQIDYDGPSPAIAAKTLHALVRELQNRLSQFATLRSEAELQVARDDQQTAQAAADAAHRAVADYTPRPAAAGGADPMLATLARAADTADRQLASATARVRSSQNAIANAGAQGAIVRLIDSPAAPPNSNSGKMRLFLGLFAGAFVGALISLLLLISLTPSSHTSQAPVAGTFVLSSVPATSWPSTPAAVAAKGRPGNGAQLSSGNPPDPGDAAS